MDQSASDTASTTAHKVWGVCVCVCVCVSARANAYVWLLTHAWVRMCTVCPNLPPQNPQDSDSDSDPDSDSMSSNVTNLCSDCEGGRCQGLRRDDLSTSVSTEGSSSAPPPCSFEGFQHTVKEAMKNRADAVLEPEYALSPDVLGFGGDKGSKFHVKLVPESANDFEIHHEKCHGHAEGSGSLCKSCSSTRFRKAMQKRIRTAVASRAKAPGVQAPRFTWANSPTKVWVTTILFGCVCMRVSERVCISVYSLFTHSHRWALQWMLRRSRFEVSRRRLRGYGQEIDA